MRLALASQPVRNGDVAWNVRCMEDVLRACSGRADTVVFGESVLQGFDCLRWDYARDCTVAAAWTDEPVRHLQAAARENGAAVSFGMIERAADGCIGKFSCRDGLMDKLRDVHVVSSFLDPTPRRRMSGRHMAANTSHSLPPSSRLMNVPTPMSPPVSQVVSSMKPQYTYIAVP